MSAAGERKLRIRIEQNGSAKDEANQPVDDWQLVMEKLASYRTTRGMSAVRAAQEGVPGAPQRGSWSFGYTPTGINIGMRVNWNGNYYDIIDIKHDHVSRKWTDLVVDG